MVYCVAVNSARSLVHHCSLQPMLSNKKEAQEANLVYECTKANHLQVGSSKLSYSTLNLECLCQFHLGDKLRI